MNPHILEVHLENHPRSGKTTIAVAMVRGMVEMGYIAVIVCPTDDFARDAARRNGLPLELCMGFHRFARNPTSWDLIVLDGYFRMPAFEGITALEYTRHKMLHRKAGQMVLIP